MVESLSRNLSLSPVFCRVLAHRGFGDADAARARPMRSKTETRDYRYFPDPDLPPLVLDPGMVEAARAALPELPAERARRLVTQYGLPAYDAEVLTASRALADYFEETAAAAGDPKAASNWVMTDVLARVNRGDGDLEAYPVPPHRLGELVRLVGEGVVSVTTGRDVLARMEESGRRAPEIIEARRYVGPTILILPKWIALPADRMPGVDARQGWVMLAAAAAWLQARGLDAMRGPVSLKSRKSRKALR